MIRKILKWLGIVLGSLIGLLLLAFAVLYVTGTVKWNKLHGTYDVPIETVLIPTDQDSIARGEHVASIHMCGYCHTDSLSGQSETVPGLITLTFPNLTTGRGGVGVGEDGVGAARRRAARAATSTSVRSATPDCRPSGPARPMSSAFALNRACLESVGYFDENFHPAYFEDNDYHWRCRQKKVEVRPLVTASTHVGSATIFGNPEYRARNKDTFEENKDYYRAKWGGTPGEERWSAPFMGENGGAEPPIEPARIRRLAWERR